ncbi:MAG: ATP-binding protein [Candidatus Methanoplasma sp.]|jgi:predicted AAA+ superfamily ATPase|nr:ATP-binding protein [Candidatus Methanoplasma sp.]
MKEVLRRRYLSRLMREKDRKHLVKIITGIRRCGKSTLMAQFIRLLKESGVSDENIVSLNAESFEFDGKDYSYLYDKVKDRRVEGRMYVFIDEIQRIPGWERAVNAFMVDFDADIYITGSNGRLLSTELSTNLSGRCVQIAMLPFSFGEFLEMNDDGSRSKEHWFNEYVRKGSMPVINANAPESDINETLVGVFNTVVVKDVLTRMGAPDASKIEGIARFLFSNTGNTTSVHNIAVSMGEDDRAVKRCVESLMDAYVIHKAERFDIRGKKLLKTMEKYYVADTGMRNAVLGISSREDDSRLIENIVYLELRRRGYDVAVGKFGDSEVDFTAARNGAVEYYQVSRSIVSDSTYDREMRPLNGIRDHRKKTILTLDGFLSNVPDGIIHKNIIDWLTEE